VNEILDQGKKLEPVLLLPSATEQTLPLTDIDVCEEPKRLKREWETPTEVTTVSTEVLIPRIIDITHGSEVLFSH
jgi:hypothetical protein